MANTKNDCAQCQFDLCEQKHGLGGKICLVKVIAPQQKTNCNDCSVPSLTAKELTAAAASFYQSIQAKLADCFQLPARLCPMMASAKVKMDGKANSGG